MKDDAERPASTEQPPIEVAIHKSHPRIFHYTTAAGLHGILRYGKFWLTHYTSLNDTTEFAAFRPLLQKVFCETLDEMIAAGRFEFIDTPPKQPISDIVRDQADAIIDVLIGALFTSKQATGEPFVASFCGTTDDSYVNENGLLNLWQTYGPDGGYAIEFSTELLDLAQQTFVKSRDAFSLFDAVVYDEHSSGWAEVEQKMSLIAKSAVPAALSVYDGEGQDGTVLENACKEFLAPFIEVVTRIKHPAFAVEREVRLVVVRTRIPESGRKKLPANFRLNGGIIVPYVELFDDVRPAIRRIIVGPHKDADSRAKALDFWVKEAGLDIVVSNSAIPYLAK